MVDVKKLGKKHVHYCTHCDNRASYLLYFTNPVIIQQGSNGALCEKCFELLDEVRIDIIKGNASEIARLSGEAVQTKGVDAAEVKKDLVQLAQSLAKKRHTAVVITGKEDIVADERKVYIVKNGHPMMANIVGTGCMAASVIGTFAAVEKDLSLASAAALVVFEIAAECAAKDALGPGTFKERIFDCLFNLDKKTIDSMQKVEA